MFNIVHASLTTKAKRVTHERRDYQKRVKYYKIINFICLERKRLRLCLTKERRSAHEIRSSGHH